MASLRLQVGCRRCGHIREIRWHDLAVPAAVPLSSVADYVTCDMCGESNSDTRRPIFVAYD
jgi:hypothetical protein